MTYLWDDRDEAALLTQLRRIAATVQVPGFDDDWTWDSLLFGPARPHDDPSRLLLEVAVSLLPGLGDHAAHLPERALVHWLETTLGIPRLPVVGDTVVATVEADPAQVPLAVPQGTLLRGGKEVLRRGGGVVVAGAERRYATTAPLTVLGATSLGARSYRAATGERDMSGSWDGTVHTAPFRPFATPSAQPAPHVLRIRSDALASGGHGTQIDLEFIDGSAIDQLRQLTWWASSKEEGLVELPPAMGTGSVVQLRLDQECSHSELDGERVVFLEARASDPWPSNLLDVRFSDVRITVACKGLPADGGAYNDGIVDTSREFMPFGPTPRRGDSFYIRCDEAFSKPLHSLTINLGQLAEVSSLPVGMAGQWEHFTGDVQYQLEEQATDLGLESSDVAAFGQFLAGQASYFTSNPKVVWERLNADHDWNEWFADEELKSTPSGNAATNSGGGDEEGYSLPATVAGLEGGRWVRAFLRGGDFGWVAYQQGLADFAAAAAGLGNPPAGASAPIPPEPPLLTSVEIDYRSGEVQPTSVEATNGHGTRTLSLGGTSVSPFITSVPVIGEAAGFVAIGVDLPDAALGSSLSVWIDVDAASGCGSVEAPSEWEFATDGPWAPLEVDDGTLGLRQAGVLRLVSPLGWATGAKDLDETAGRWLRIHSNAPDVLGVVQAIVPDAVEAVYSSRVSGGDVDLTPTMPLDPGDLKGLVSPIAGIKKATNPAPGIPGRADEADESYAKRATYRARHRDRAVQPWDYEAIVLAEFPEVALALALPTYSPDGPDQPGWVGLLVIPQSNEPAPLPSVHLADRIKRALRNRMPLRAKLHVVCPTYHRFGVDAGVVLRHGVSAASARSSVTNALDREWRAVSRADNFGRRVFASSVIAFMEALPEVDHVTDLALSEDGAEGCGDCSPTCLTVSSGVHSLRLKEQL